MPDHGAGISRRGFIVTGALGMAGLSLAGLTGCGRGGGQSTGSQSVSFGTFVGAANTAAYNTFLEQFTDSTGIDVDLTDVTGDYVTKMRTQLIGGRAPDVFLADDSIMGQAIESGLATNFSSWWRDNTSTIPLDRFYPALSAFCQDGSGDFYGVPQDSNPVSFWFNQDLLDQAGVDTNPAQLQESGDWTMESATEILTKLKSTQKTPMAIETQWWYWTSWVTALGGQAFDESGRCVWDTDPDALAALSWLFDQLANGNLIYAGTLPEGQAVDALFYSGQLATCQYGRWIASNLQQVQSFSYDIAPFPSKSGGDFAPVGILVGAICVNAESPNIEAASELVADFCGVRGQKYRVEQGVVVPTIDDESLVAAVAEAEVPAHGHWYTDIAANAYHPLYLSRNPEGSAALPDTIDKLIRDKTDYKTFAEQTAAVINGDA
ncbi:ABC transporter substrate-binding protein [Jiangella alkaliphila]|uniref:Multiple sugar transport system substrate-binding protein n=1 Tax=Jiangella alkaliphila TaxID=419479 RepID=A0A1H2LEL7_9ACTN|nr:extracellular solute-binding protein [Jiangella alkaliphila]SDU79175.1 multiple sugar transport system substrate-binding protein [Jiangella alkaliphila]